MANTITIKFSQVTATPSSLQPGELAYSTNSSTLFIGNGVGTPIAIGGAAAFTKLAGIAEGAEVNTVDSVAGKTGAVTLDIADVSGLATALADKADSSALAGYLALAGGTLSGALTLAADPTNPLHAATKQYVDAVANGLDFKASVLVATTAAGVLASDFENGSTLDGVTLATGDRILIKNQTDASENGIYTVNVSGAPTRSVDADTDAEVTKGMFMFVESGTTNAASAWVLSGKTGTLGTGNLTFTQFSGGSGAYTAGTGLLLTGSVFSLDNHSAALITSGTLDDARLSANVLLNTSTVDGGSF